MQNAPLGAFCNTFDQHQAIIGLLFEWPFKTGSTVFNLIFGRKMQLIVFSCVS